MTTRTAPANTIRNSATASSSSHPERTRRVDAVIGVSLLAAFLLYGVGSMLAQDAQQGPRLHAGAGMMLLNSAVVVLIGILARTVLRAQAPAVGDGYLLTRLLEGALLGAGAIAMLLSAPELNSLLYNLGMIVLAVGSLSFCAALYHHRLVPRPVAIWGVIGYAAFAVGCTLELAGVSDAGLYGAAPGGLFEVALALLLIIKGFNQARS